LIETPIKIYSPYNIKTQWRSIEEDKFVNPDYIEFKDWVYIADENKLWPLKFKQHCEVLGLYNVRGWFLNNWNEKNKDRNWQVFFNSDAVLRIKEEKIKEKNVEVKTEIEVKEVQVMPRMIVETMTVPQLKEILKSWCYKIKNNWFIRPKLTSFKIRFEKIPINHIMIVGIF